MRLFWIALLVFLAWCQPLTAARLGSDWHPDPDGDGIATSSDLCPWVYDPDQVDLDGDGLGNSCDPDFAPPAPDGAVSDLRAEHATPFGAWLTFTSPYDREFGWTVALAWSTDPAELSTLAGFQTAFDRGDAVQAQIAARYGEPIRRPLIVTGLAPGTTYYLAATELAWDGLVNLMSPILELQTLADPAPTPAASRPRLFSTPAHISELQTLRATGDGGWATWEAMMRPRAHQAAVDPASVYLARHYCSSAALLHLVSGNATDLADATALLDLNIVYWEDNVLDGNQYRWEDSQLALCLDLLWEQLGATTRNRAVAAFLGDDETHVAAGLPRLDDTDEFASTTRTWLVDGLAGCGAAGIDTDLAARSCAVLDAGLDLWHGVQLVKARRDRGFWAQSGGFLPDGTDYGQGTAIYWLQSFLALSHNGGLAGDWGPFVRHNLISLVLQALTPSRLGFVTAGDVEDFSYNFGVEDNSFQLELADAGLLALAAGTLDRVGDPTAAAWARFLADDLYPDEPSADGLYHLLFGAEALAAADHRNALATTHFDSGNGIFLDRTSWSAQASLLFHRGGWNGVDHSHGDVGHFQLYRRGRWITHEAIGYDGPAATASGHNVLLLSAPEGGNPGQPGQNRFFTSLNRMRRASSGSHHAAVILDSTGAYSPDTEIERYYSAVQRSLLWLKTDELSSPDVLVVLDLDRRTPSAPAGVDSRWQLHLDAAPTLAGTTATVTLSASPVDQHLVASVLLPADATLSVLPPEGPPDTYPAQIYTHRLVVDTAASPGDELFLVVLQAADIGDAQPAPQLVSASDLAGALIGSDLVLLPTFSIAADTDGVTSFALDVATTAALRVFVAGIAPASGVTVTASQNAGTLHLAATSGGILFADTGGVVAFVVDEARNVTPIYVETPLFADGFESGDLTAWSAFAP